MKSPRRTTLASSGLACAALSSPGAALSFSGAALSFSGAALSFSGAALSFATVALSILAFGCAGVKNPQVSNGTGGNSGMVVAPPIPGLQSIDVSPASQMVLLQANGTMLTGSATYMANGHFDDGHTEDVTSKVGWSSQFATLTVVRGVANVRAPGVYTITAVAGGITATGQLKATFQGNLLGNGFDPSGQGTLDGTVGGATQISYPLDRSIFPPNMSPVTMHIARASGQSAARINFAVDDVVNVNYYAACQPGAGTGCYVDLPLELTQLFVAVSETKDVQVTARVGGLGAPLAESAPISVAWANVPLSGGLYYWTTLASGIVMNYVPPNNADNTPGTTGTGIQRYDFGKDGATGPQLVWTDRGRFPTFLGSPPATTDGAQCVGCHAISSDGKTMALTIGGLERAGLRAAGSDHAELYRAQRGRVSRRDQHERHQLLQAIPGHRRRDRDHLRPQCRRDGQHVQIEAVPARHDREPDGRG